MWRGVRVEGRHRWRGHTSPALFVLLAAWLLLSGCAGREEVPLVPPTPTPTWTPSPTPTPRPTSTPTPTPTPTPLPLVTPPPEGLPHHLMRIALRYDEAVVEVGQEVGLVNATPDRWGEVVFAVPPAYYGAFTLYRCEVTTVRQKAVTTATLDGAMLRVPLPSPVLPGEPVAVYLSYAVQLPPVAPTAWPPAGNFGAGEALLQVGDWHPTLVPYRTGEGWQRWSYYPVGDPVVYPLANYEVELVAPPDVVVAAAGAVTVTGTLHRYALPHARCFAFLASRMYRSLRGDADGVPVTAYYLPEYATAAQAVMDTARQAMALYQELYGPYPYADLVIAQNAYYGAMEYSGLVSLTGYGYRSYRGRPSDLLITLTAHEIAHQWWYGAVGNDQVHEPWLDEAFAKYSEVLFYERYHPDLVNWWWERSVYRWQPSRSLRSTIYDFDDTPTYIHEIYGQGARFLGDLRDLMGDAAFFNFVRDYRQRGEGKLVSGQLLLATARRHTEADLTPLITAYFGEP